MKNPALLRQKFLGAFALLAALWLSPCAASRAADNVVIKTAILESHFYRPVKEPLYVKYALYKGGGDCNRSQFRFVNDQPGLVTATAKDYAASGFDQGHLANAEDFAGDCTKEKLTFVFYNALPQTPNLNRGVWKRYETTIRKWSQTDHLLVICGGYNFHQVKLLYVPSNCFKVVQSQDTGKILFCGTFTNTSKATETDVSEPALEKTLGYKLPIQGTAASKSPATKAATNKSAASKTSKTRKSTSPKAKKAQ